MKSTIGPALGAHAHDMLRNRVRAVTQVRAHGNQRTPALVRSVQAQPAEGGVQVSWHLPTRYQDVTGFRVYVGSEKNLAIDVKDRGTRQMFIPTQSGSAPPTANIFVSAINGYREGHAVQVQSAPIPNAQIPNVKPGPPTDFVDQFSGGLDKTQNGQPTGKRTA